MVSAGFGLDNTNIPSLRDAVTSGNTTNNYYISNLTGNLTNLSQLDDTTITAPANGEVLTWSSAVMKWVNGAVVTTSKWIFGSSPYWYNDSTTAYFNETHLNVTIDARASGSGDNASWNKTYADTLYPDIKWGYNMTYSGSTYNATYDAMSAGDNASWNKTYADTLYATIGSVGGNGTSMWETNGSRLYNTTVNEVSVGTSDAYVEINNKGEFTFWAG